MNTKQKSFSEVVLIAVSFKIRYIAGQILMRKVSLQGLPRYISLKILSSTFSLLSCSILNMCASAFLTVNDHSELYMTLALILL